MRKSIMLIGLMWLAVDQSRGDPANDLAAIQQFYRERFPEIALEAHRDGAYALDAQKREQWLEMEDFPPYEIAIDDGAELYEIEFANGGSYADCLGEGAPAVKHRYPYFDSNSGEVITLDLALNRCRETNGEPALDYLGEEMGALTAYIAYQSRDRATAIDVPEDPRAQAAYEAGKQFYFTRRGQLNFACSSCHMQLAGNKLRAETLSASLGHSTHWPVYRLKWQQVGPLHKRFMECNTQVKAIPLELQSETYRNLEYFLTFMSNGLPLNGPASRK